MRSPSAQARSSPPRHPAAPASALQRDRAGESPPRHASTVASAPAEAVPGRAPTAARAGAQALPAPASTVDRAGARAALTPERSAPVADAIRIVAGLSIAAGAIHAIAMIEHFSHYWLYGVFFLVLTYGQVLWGIALLRRRVVERALTAGAVANVAIVAVWVLSRTLGVPVGPDAGRPEAVGAMDVVATLDQLVLAAYVAAIVRPRLRTGRGFRALMGAHRMRIGIALGSASLFAALLGGHHHP
jgi:hypothetical protein